MEMTDFKWDSAIIDTDFTFKMNNIRDVNAIEEYVPLFVGKLYIHEYVYQNEILTPKRAREQIDNLIANGKAEIVSIADFDDDFSKLVYTEIIGLMKRADPQTVEKGKNWGETVSIAYAKAKGLHYFFSDERDLQNLLDEHINSGNNEDIKTIRVIDFIFAMKEARYKRKAAYRLWMAAHGQNNLEWAKEKFREDIWPLST